MSDVRDLPRLPVHSEEYEAIRVVGTDPLRKLCKGERVHTDLQG